MSEASMDSQAMGMDMSQLQQFISSQVQQHTTGLNAQVTELQNRNQQLMALVSQLQVGQNVRQQYNNQLSESDRPKLAATYLEGNAATWWRSLVMQTDDRTGDGISWNDFQQGLISMFKPVNAKKIARDKLASLKQTNSVAKYNFDFTQLCLEINDIHESEKLDKYVRGLKEKIRVEVELAEPTTLAQAMSKAHRIDNITYQTYISQHSEHSNRK